ncbi:MAG: double-strand break repair protein AddB, partial [Maricaulaceae bacterium]
MKRLFEAPTPRVFTIQPHRPFLDDLARVLRETLYDPKEPFALADAMILAPNRRAARELGAAFVRAAGEDPPATLLPSIRALGDLDDEEPPFEPGAIALDLPPPLSPSRRRFELAGLLHARALHFDPEADPAASLPLADELGRLLDEIAATDGVDLAPVEEMFANLPEHLQHSAVFLDIVLKHWPARVTELGRMDATKRRDAVLRALAEAWTDNPPQTPMIAAGSTGSLDATRDVLAAVAAAPQGLVVLPGVDLELDARAWDGVGNGHPQENLKATLERLDVEREVVAVWPGVEELAPARARRRLVNEALRPAAATDDWLARIAALDAEFGGKSGDVVASALDGLTLIEAPTQDGEARAIALAVRHALETPDAEVIVTTPDLGLADRVFAALERHGIEPDFSAGRPLIETAPGGFLAHVLACARDRGDPLGLCALVKHELTALGRAHRTTRIRFAEVERKALRGVRPGADLSAVVARLKAHKDAPSAEALDVVARLEAALAPLTSIKRDETRPVAELAAAHAEATEAIAEDDALSGAARIWRDEAGEAAAALMRELIEDAEAFPACTLDSYAGIYERLAMTRAVRERGRDARVRILGPLEARLQSADLIIAAGLNEGVWPSRPAEDPFLSRGMRTAAGLAAPEHRLSLAAHDFVQLACAPNVILTRAKRDASGPTVASRWLWRLQTLLRGANAEMRGSETDYLAIAASLDRVAPADARPAMKPAPTPPVKARPTKLSASRVREWVRDPYGFYARMILGLAPLDPIDMPTGPRERGQAIHDALHQLVAAHTDDLPADFAERLASSAMAALGKLGFGPEELVAEEERMSRAAAWFAAWETRRRAAGWRPGALEERAEAKIKTRAGALTVYAIADRVDTGPGGTAILDYKTGEPPSRKQVAAGLEPQLGVEAVIQKHVGFGSLKPSAPTQLLYLRVRGGRVAGAELDLNGGREPIDPANFAEETEALLAKGFESYARPERAYE